MMDMSGTDATNLFERIGGQGRAQPAEDKEKREKKQAMTA